MNQLQKETSPYLLQHSNNPVHWMAWGDEAFQKAKEENKPVLVSIGYSSCHWCHVMEHESFEDIETANLMNQLFINIKVDREEYPDVDHMYMDAVQAMTGSGGWPLNIFVTPDKKPFYGGTYFPPTRAHGRASWKEVLINVSQYFSQNRNDVEEQALKLLGHLHQNSFVNLNRQSTLEEPNIEVICKQIKQQLLSNADKEHGGFGTAPKFPSTFSIKYLLDHFVLYQDQAALDHALLSLDKMAMGGIYDHIGGGFARYSTDTKWIAPHFEKMLYDNALLIEVYAIAFSITKKDLYKKVIDQTIQWLKREMMSEEGGFYSAQDADSEGIEGKYYTWSYNELQSVLLENFEWFKAYFNIKEDGNWEHTNILYTTDISANLISEEHSIKLQQVLSTLFEYRNRRIKPLTDDKILLAWNALMNKALINAYLYVNDTSYLALAEKNMFFMLQKFKNAEYLYHHTYKEGKAKIAAFADDLAYLADAFISFANATSNTTFYDKAKELVDFLDQYFLDTEKIYYRFTHRDFTQVEINKVEMYDGAMASPNAVLCKVLHHLYMVYHNEEWHKRSQVMLAGLKSICQKHPSSFAVWCCELQNQGSQAKEVSIVGEDAQKVYLALHTKKYTPNILYITSHKENNLNSLKGKYQAGETLIYICKDFYCLEPLKDINDVFIEI